MIGTILSFLGSSAFGSIIGVIGNWLNQKQIMRNKKLENDHELEMAKVQIDILRAKTDASIKITQAKVQGAVDLEESKSYTTNIVVANQKSFSDKWLDKLLEMKGWWRIISLPLSAFLMCGFAFIDIFKGVMRPGLTTFFTAAFAWITYTAYGIIKEKGFATLTPDQAVLYFTMAVDTCIMLTTTCVTWWYADRRMAKTLARMQEKRLESPNVRRPVPTEEEE